MNLAFRTKFPKKLKLIGGKPTHFVKQIAASLKIVTGGDLPAEYCPPDFNLIEVTENNGIKHHTLREDKSDSWKAGNDIHFIINNRTPKRFQFAPVIPCLSTQKMEIKTENAPSEQLLHSSALIKIGDCFKTVSVDGRIMSHGNVRRIALNDGFKSVEEFFAYFHKDFEGKIIHWTNLKY